MDRVSKEFDFTAYFLYHDYGITEVELPVGVTCKGQNIIPISSSYLRGQIQDDNENSIIVNDFIEKHVKLIYRNRIVPLFGEYDKEGKMIKQGSIYFYEQKENPTGIQKKIIAFAAERGKFIAEEFQGKDGKDYKKLVSYVPNNPEEYIIIIYDTIRKIPRERGFTLKENIDKMIEYSVDLRNLCKYIFIPIIHLNRAMSDVQRMKYMGDLLYPSSDDVKDSGLEKKKLFFIFAITKTKIIWKLKFIVCMNLILVK